MAYNITMKNILSYINNPTFSGQEIIDWISYQIENHTSHEKMARWLHKKFSNIKPEANYYFCEGEERTNARKLHMIRRLK